MKKFWKRFKPLGLTKQESRQIKTLFAHCLSALLLSALFIGSARADATDSSSASSKARSKPLYRVQIEAPTPLRTLLEQHLDLARYQSRTDLSDAQLGFMLATAAEQVAQLIATEGYFTPHTSITQPTQAADATQVIEILVDPGPRTTVAATDIQIGGMIASEDPQRSAALQSAWTLPPPQPFRQADWDSAKTQTLDALQKSRYAAAKLLSAQANIAPAQHTARLTAHYDSGPAFSLGALNITGTKRYPASIIENVNPLQRGEPYSVERLLALQRQIQNTPYFNNVIVSIDDNPAQADMTPVNVHVSEFPKQRIRSGVGYSTDTGVQTEGRYTHYNVLDRAWVFDSKLNIEQRQQSGMLELALPPDSRSYVNSVNSAYQRTTLEGVDIRSLRIGIKRARSREFYDTAYTVDFYSDRLEQANGAALPVDTVTAPGVHRALMPGFSWAKRDIDDAIFPRQGHLLSIQAGVALKGLLTDQSFARLTTRYRLYVPIGKRDLMIFRTELGAVLTDGSNTAIPATLLFRAGGSDSVRGYAYQSIGNKQNGTVYPNKYLATASAEYQHWFTHQWGSALFYDIGTAADNWRNKQFYAGTGVGARWRSPVGTVNADLAYAIQERQFRPHISLGIAF